ncbi:solute carrier organic anion transporter family member 4A1-like isoform X1 [Temnothorax curvispinosus]|uniref:Solute carrier organic anion transporter family member n=1 Tax=Temnothorax curvispinosus TaxID=300111 RepID=A0A6J1PIG6_9HYME|nr:solute carrier organic anion transporter family member 4A1-like isoform X1 [Temnothorax curvispinosus]XP_024869143.1 solute carrier organic anion transporter family member 4A1-like isoform X1 [Temnothorax curvispinosus]XP_024875183.1 solute carrier organic anion transporter family member 4A1-like isoform X1 [Temnothorax curvispinosus]
MTGIYNLGYDGIEPTSGVPDMHETLSSFPEQFGDGPRKPEIKPEIPKETDRTADNLKCGWFWFRPIYLQKFRTAKWALFWLCWAGAMQGMVVNGFVNVVITTIERRFGLKSSETGLIAGGYDIASFLLLVPVSYLGGRAKASKPRYIGIGILVLGIGSLLFASPHYLAGPYRGGQQTENTCQSVSNISSHSISCTDQSTVQAELEPYSGVYLTIFLVAQLLHGAGAAPFYTLGVTYLDENVSKKMSSVYLGVYYTMAIIGPALGYVVGGELLKIYTDFLTVDSSTIGLSSDSNVWIGAWWIGFLAAAVMCFVIAIPVLAFPAVLPGSEELAKDRVSEAHEKSTRSSTAATGEAFSKIRELPRALTELLGNPAFFMLNLAGASEGLLIAGFAAFLPKLIENQFSVSASSAALLMGLVTVPAGGGGTFLGGYLIKRLNLPCSDILKFCLLATTACIAFTLCFALNCPNLDFAGLTVPYQNITRKIALSLENTCNNGCGCSRSQFDPICGVDGITYYSPCHAGCYRETPINNVKVYTDCSCIHVPAMNLTSDDTGDVVQYEAINTTCASSCSYLWLFIVLAFCNMFMTFLCTMPALSSTLRVVRDDQRSFALGIQWIKVRILGTIPAPMVFGALIDDTCILWNETCDGRGACLVYDNYYMSRYMLALAFIGKAASLLFFFLAWWTYVPPSTRGIDQNSRQQTTATLMLSDTSQEVEIVPTAIA